MITLEAIKLFWAERKVLILAALILGLAIWLGDLYLTRGQARGDVAAAQGQLSALQSRYDALVAANKALADADAQRKLQAAPAVQRARKVHEVVQPVIDTLDGIPSAQNECERGVSEAKAQLNRLGGVQ